MNLIDVPSLSQFQSLLQTAEEAAHKAGHVLKDFFRKPNLKTDRKPGAGWVTEADFAAQKALLEVLQKVSPEFHFNFLTEETLPESFPRPFANPQGRWIIDPLDGTTNFMRGFPFFCVSIGLEWQKEVILGVIHAPLFEETYTAILGQGAFLNRTLRLQVSSLKNLRQAVFTSGFSYRKKQLPLQMRIFQALQNASQGLRKTGSAALDLAHTARGTWEGFWGNPLSPWDIAAGSLLVKEAGGVVSRCQGEFFSLEEGDILATTPAFHSFLVQEIRKASDLP